MKKHELFALNLVALQKYRGQSLGELAEDIGVAKSTLQSVRSGGHTSLDTALRIADGLGLPLDSLTGDGTLPEKIRLAQCLLQSVDWFRALSPDEQEEVLRHFQRILEVICK